jgi:DinB superfamily
MVINRSALGLVLALVVGTRLHAQAALSTAKTATEIFQQSVSGPERATLRLTEAMPEANYSFVPTNGKFSGVRSFAQLSKHIAVDNYMMGAALLGQKVPIEVGVHENGSDGISTKAQITKFLRDSFLYLHKAVDTVDQKNLMESVSYEGVALPRLAVVNAAISHPWDIYGQMVEYLRMNGIDPQQIP